MFDLDFIFADNPTNEDPAPGRAVSDPTFHSTSQAMANNFRTRSIFRTTDSSNNVVIELGDMPATRTEYVFSAASVAVRANEVDELISDDNNLLVRHHFESQRITGSMFYSGTNVDGGGTGTSQIDNIDVYFNVTGRASISGFDDANITYTGDYVFAKLPASGGFTNSTERTGTFTFDVNLHFSQRRQAVKSGTFYAADGTTEVGTLTADTGFVSGIQLGAVTFTGSGDLANHTGTMAGTFPGEMPNAAEFLGGIEGTDMTDTNNPVRFVIGMHGSRDTSN